MKLKGINPFEQHVEKILVSVLGVGLLGIVAMQFLVKPNLIKVGSASDVAPEQGLIPVEREAQNLKARMTAGSPELPKPPEFTLQPKFVEGLRGVQTEQVRTALGAAVNIGGGDLELRTAEAVFNVVRPMAPSMAVANAHRAAISPVEVVRNPELASLLPSEQPFDKAAVSVEAVFDGVALRTLLESDPEGASEAVPPAWWKDQFQDGRYLVDMVAVEVERETIRRADGSSPGGGAVATVRSIPGRFDGRAYWTQAVKVPGDVPSALQEIAPRGEEIQRPKYLETVAGAKWMPPSEALAMGGDADQQREIDRLQRQRSDQQSRIQRLQELLAKLPAGTSGQQSPGAREPGGGGAPPPGAGGGRGGRGGSGGGDRRDPGGRQGGQDNEQGGNRLVVESQLRDAQRRLKNIEDRLVALGVVLEPTAEAGTGPDSAKLAAVLDNPEVKVWAHDLQAVPGETYRYRVRVWINNPLFGRPLKEEQKDAAAEALVASAWSDWTPAVEVPRDDYFFVTSALERDPMSGRSRATAEMYVFYYGYYRSATVSVEPGDVIAAEAKLPPTLKFADLEKLRTDLQGDGVAPAPAPTAPAPIAPGGRRGPGGAVPGPGAPAVPGATNQPENQDPYFVIPAPTVRQLAVDAVLLSVSQTASVIPGVVAQSRLQAVMRTGEGGLEVRYPDDERGRQAYELVKLSAREGERQGQPKQEKPVDQPARPMDPERPQSPRQPGGGAGGG